MYLFNKDYRPVQITLAITFLCCLFFLKKNVWEGKEIRIIDGDGKGYYRYLPDIFITHSFGHQPADGRYIIQSDQGTVYKYFPGTAMAMSPFFLAAYFIEKYSGMEQDGYSRSFHQAISLSALFYFIMGLFFSAMLLSLYKINPGIIASVIVFIGFGTNLLAYGMMNAAFSHVYSFCFISAFLFFLKNYFLKEKYVFLWLAAGILGMIVLIRPINILILLLLPFLTGSLSETKKFMAIFFKQRNFVPAFLIFSAILSVQFLSIYYQTGRVFFNTYSGEGFNFLHPEFIEVLFGFRKGLFIYIPVFFLCIFGLFVFFRSNKFQFYSLLLFLLPVIYCISAWWNWYFAGSFGHRAFVDFYSLHGLLLAVALDKYSGKLSGKISYGFAVLCVFLNLIQIYQYKQNILSQDNMDMDKYKFIFLKTAPEYSGCLGGNNDLFPYSSKKKLLVHTNNDFENEYIGWSSNAEAISDKNHFHVCDYRSREFNLECVIPATPGMKECGPLFLEISLDKNQLTYSGFNSPLFVIEFWDETGKRYQYNTSRINDIPSMDCNMWKKHVASIALSRLRSEHDTIKMYVWNQYKQDFYLDNVEIKLFGAESFSATFY